jgi:hypothetical protein
MNIMLVVVVSDSGISAITEISYWSLQYILVIMRSIMIDLESVSIPV